MSNSLLSVLFVLSGVWVLSVAIPSYHYKPKNNYCRKDNYRLIPLFVVGLLNLFIGIYWYRNRNQISEQIQNLSMVFSFVSLIVVSVILTMRQRLASNGKSHEVWRQEKTKHPDGSVTTQQIKFITTPSPGDEYVDDAVLGLKSNWSLIGVICLNMLISWSIFEKQNVVAIKKYEEEKLAYLATLSDSDKNNPFMNPFWEVYNDPSLNES